MDESAVTPNAVFSPVLLFPLPIFKPFILISVLKVAILLNVLAPAIVCVAVVTNPLAVVEASGIFIFLLVSYTDFGRDIISNIFDMKNEMIFFGLSKISRYQWSSL